MNLSRYDDMSHEQAESHFLVAFEQTPSRFHAHKRKALVGLVVSRWVRGLMPRPSLLQKYHLGPLLELQEPFKQGNASTFLLRVEQHRAFFKSFGLYMIFKHRFVLLLIRNLMVHTYGFALTLGFVSISPSFP